MPFQSKPFLPVEIYSSILDFVGERDFGETFQPDQLLTLRTCALTCKHFAALCQRHIFRYVDLNDDFYFDEEIYLRLVELLEQRPELALHVREFDLYLQPYTERPLFFDRCRNAFLMFTNLQHLSVNVMSGRDSESHPFWDKLCGDLIGTYLGTLRSLKTQRNTLSASLPVTDIFSSSTLRILDLCLARPFHQQTELLPISNITHLYAWSPTLLPLSVFLALPQLEQVWLSSAKIAPDVLSDSRLPSFKLKGLHLQNRDSRTVSEFLDLYITRARTAQTDPFLHLEMLEITLSDNAIMNTLSDCLGRMPALTLLNIEWISHEPTSFPFRTLDIARHIRETFHGLDTLSLEFRKLNQLDYTDTGNVSLLAQTNEFLTSIAGQNILQSLCLQICNKISTLAPSDFPDYPIHGEVARQLADNSLFPNLKTVVLEMVCCLPRGIPNTGPGRPRRLVENNRELTAYMLSGMLELSKRDGLEFTGCVTTRRV